MVLKKIWGAIHIFVVTILIFPAPLFRAVPVYAGELAAPTPGDLIINEIMQNPDTVSDTKGEWFEIYNSTEFDIDLAGLEVTDGDDQDFTVTSGSIPSHGFFVFGRNGEVTENGGYVPDFVWSDFVLSNTSDVIILQYNNVEIDHVEYDNGVTFPNPVGDSMILSETFLDNSMGENWCVSVTPYGSGDAGTPGAINDVCEKEEEENKITICHHPVDDPENPLTLVINESAWTAHEEHGDTLGACEEVEPPQTQSASISGCKFLDVNANGAWDENETTIPGWEILLENGVGEIRATTTDATGCYVFTDVVPDEYLLTETVTEGFVQTFPVLGNYEVAPADGEQITEKHFGNALALVTSCGNGIVETEEGEVCDNGFENNGVVCTPEYGGSCQYCSPICEIVEIQGGMCGDGVVDTENQEQCDDGNIVDGDGCSALCQSDSEVITGSICGVKFFDHDGDAVKDQEDETLAGWDIVLTPKLECSEDDPWADEIVSFSQGKKNFGADVDDMRSNPNTVLGAAEESQTEAEETFFSLGFGGEIVVRFSNLIENLDGDDIRVYETTLNRDAYPRERAQVYASQDNVHWVLLGDVDNKSNTTVDLGTLEWAQYVRLVDITSSALHDENADGFDVDAIQVIYCRTFGQETRVTTLDEGYCFENLSFGDYHVREIMKGGWVNTTAIGQQVTLSTSTPLVYADFGNQPDQTLQPGVICGYIFEDVNADGLWQASENETGLGNWKVQATDGIATYETTSSTDEENLGEYCFMGLSPATWTITEIPEDFWIPMTPQEIQIELGAFEGSINNNFGNFELGAVSGIKFNDENGNGVVDEGESGLEGWEIRLTSVGGGTTTATTTDALGFYKFTGLLYGSYEITEATSTEWMQTYPTTTPGYVIEIRSGASISGLNFLNQRNEAEPPETPEEPAPAPEIPTPSTGGGGGIFGLTIHTESTAEDGSDSSINVVITWFTNLPATSRVVYDTVSHPELGTPPNYGYAFSTETFDQNPKVTYHTVTIFGLNSNTTYYLRPISSASPEIFGKEIMFTTSGAVAEESESPEIKEEVPPQKTTVSAPQVPPSETEGQEFGVGGEIPGQILGTEFAEEPQDSEEDTDAESDEEVYSEEVSPLPTETAEVQQTPQPTSRNQVWRFLFWIILLLIVVYLFFLWYNKEEKEDGKKDDSKNDDSSGPQQLLDKF